MMKQSAFVFSVIAAFSGRLFADDLDDVRKAAQQVAAMTNYSAKIIDDGGKARYGYNAVSEPYFDKDAGWHGTMTSRLKEYTFEFARKNRKLAIKKEGDSKWRPITEERNVTLQEIAENIRPPHEEMKEFDALIAKVTSNVKAADGSVTLAGILTKDGAVKLNPVRSVPLSENGQRVIGGRFRLCVDKNGNVIKYEYEIDLKVNLKGKELDVTQKRVVEIRNVGTTKVDIPKEALELLN